MRDHVAYQESAFRVMDLLAHEYVLPLGASACHQSLEEHEQWQRDQRALHDSCIRDAAARQRWFRDAAGRYDQRAAQVRAEQLYCQQELDGKRPARGSE